jgi:predicted O-linked N-acetylglucosamine transferase (SPINDLY family)
LPDDAAAQSNLGRELRSLGELDAAAMRFRRALAAKPDFADAHNNLGAVLQDLGQLDEAVTCYRRAVTIKPDFADAHANLARTLLDLWQFNDAEASFRRAIEINPNLVVAHNRLGVVLRRLGQHDAAAASHRRALEIDPDHASAHNNLGIALRELGQLDAAMASYRRALEIDPDFAPAYINLGGALEDLWRFDDAVASFRRALQIDPDSTAVRSTLLCLQQYLLDVPAESLLAEARQFGDLVAQRASAHTDWANIPDGERCLRVGLVSPDLCSHPVGYFLESVVTGLMSNAAGRVEIAAYMTNTAVDEVTERIKACCSVWRPVAGVSDKRLAQQIRDDGIDILIDLSGHTVHNRLSLFAWKPAPVQVSWLGYFATTGVAAMDYLIADPWTLPESEEANFTEKIWRLPETRLCFTAPDVDIDVAPLPALSNGHITFGCFQNPNKIGDAVVTLWARVLQAVPGSRLFLKTKQFGETRVLKAVIERFAARGIDADRLAIEGFSPREEYLAAYHRVDISLDSFPFPGGTTTVESLWMGVPVLTLAGASFLARQGVGLLMNAGLPDWIAADENGYVARAVEHARDLPHLAALRKGLRQQVLNLPIFDAPRFAGHFEAALRGMWQAWCSKQCMPGSRKNVPQVNADQLIDLFNAGRYAELETRTRFLIEQYPDSGVAWKLLGASLHAQGKNALPALQKTAELQPGDAEVHNSLGNALIALGRYDDAMASYRRALAIKPDFTNAHCNLGVALHGL